MQNAEIAYKNQCSSQIDALKIEHSTALAAIEESLATEQKVAAAAKLAAAQTASEAEKKVEEHRDNTSQVTAPACHAHRAFKDRIFLHPSHLLFSFLLSDWKP